jgi:hypothetical protein
MQKPEKKNWCLDEVSQARKLLQVLVKKPPMCGSTPHPNHAGPRFSACWA